MSDEIGRAQCPSCASQGRDTDRDNLVLYDDGGAHCFACGFHTDEVSGVEMTYATPPPSEQTKPSFTEVQQWPVGLPLTARGISEETAAEFNVGVLQVKGEDYAYAYPLTKQGKVTGYQIRKLPKTFIRRGDTKQVDLFGWHRVGEGGGRMVVVCEGQDDTLAAHEMFKQLGKAYRVVGVFGTKGWKRHLDKLERFEKVMIAFDQDEAGQEAAEQLCKHLSLGKGQIVRWSGAKDANDLLNQGRASDFLRALSDSVAVRPDGIVSSGGTWERLINRPVVHSIRFPAHWELLNEHTKGMRLGELDTWTSGSGCGKTAIMRELQYHLFQVTEDNIGVIALEEPMEDSAEAIMSVHCNKRIHLIEGEDVRKQIWYREAWENTMGTNRFHFMDHFGSTQDQNLLDKVRYLASSLDCKYIFLDHLSIVVSEFANEGNERTVIDSLMTKLKSLTQELGIWIGLVVHLRKGEGSKTFELGAVPTLDDLRGSGSIKQLSNNVYASSRNQQHENMYIRNVSQLHVLKCRFTGSTGPVDHLYFNPETGRMVKAEFISEDEEGA